jgi:zinc D-Ala-D-Ala carboxypeptidase
MKLRYFKHSEFDSPDEPGSGEKMSPVLLGMLDAARKHYGKPIKVNSGFRTKAHNEKVGGVSTSSHLKGLAVDVSIDGSANRFAMYEALRKVGFKRLGVAKTFIHVDIDPDKSPNVMWVY